jgi:hypothetical protein
LNMRRIAPSSKQRACPHIPKNYRVCDWQQHGYFPPFSLIAGLSPLWFRFVSQIENETEWTTFWNSVWHPKGIRSSTRQHYGKLLPHCFWGVQKMMGSLYTFPMAYFEGDGNKNWVS